MTFGKQNKKEFIKEIGCSNMRLSEEEKQTIVLIEIAWQLKRIADIWESTI